MFLGSIADSFYWIIALDFGRMDPQAMCYCGLLLVAKNTVVERH